MPRPQPLLEIEYARAYGQHDFTLMSGSVVSAVSQPSWEEFTSTLLSAKSLGGIVLSPELITSPEALEEIPGRQAVIEARVEETRELSIKLPATLIVLGTATFSNPAGRPANSQLFIKNGAVVAQNNKRFSYFPLEKEVFTMRQAADMAVCPGSNIVGMICSDLLGESTRVASDLLLEGSDEPSPPPIVGQTTETVLVSGCWALPVQSNPAIDRNISREDRFRLALENRMLMLFRKYPALREAVMCDSLPATSGVEAPYNVHITRKTPQNSSRPAKPRPGKTLMLL